MRTERATELLKKFEDGISHAPGKGLALVLEYQDIIGNSTNKDITDYFRELDQPGRKHFLWACFMTLSEDMATDIMVNTTLKLRMEREYDNLDQHFNEEQKRVDNRTSELHLKEVKLSEKQQAYENQINNLASKVIDQTEEIVRLMDKLRSTNDIVLWHNTLLQKYA